MMKNLSLLMIVMACLGSASTARAEGTCPAKVITVGMGTGIHSLNPDAGSRTNVSAAVALPRW